MFQLCFGEKLALTFLWKQVRNPGWTEYRCTTYLKMVVACPVSGSSSPAVLLQSSVNASEVSYKAFHF